MSGATGIEWTDATWNPVRGCTRVSEGCRNCYAETIAGRFAGEGLPYEGLVRINPDGKAAGWNGQVRFVEEHLLDPLRWKKPRRIFVNSMSDLFHPGVTDEQLDLIFAVMALCPQHTFQVLTKRPERMLEYLSAGGRRSDLLETAGDLAFDLESQAKYPRSMFPRNAEVVYDLGARRDECGCRVKAEWPLPNVWLGVSVENQAAADERIPLLLQTPAAVRFLSVEPLLGPVDLRGSEPTFFGSYLNWVIVGGESGKGARPMHPDWARSLRDQCVTAGVPFFFKQWGDWVPASDHVGATKGNWGEFGPHTSPQPMRRVGKKAAGDLLDGVQWHQFPEVVA